MAKLFFLDDLGADSMSVMHRKSGTRKSMVDVTKKQAWTVQRIADKQTEFSASGL